MRRICKTEGRPCGVVRLVLQKKTKENNHTKTHNNLCCVARARAKRSYEGYCHYLQMRPSFSQVEGDHGSSVTRHRRDRRGT